MLPGECLGMNGAVCSECGETLVLKVCKSNAGYYLGYWCTRDGPESRETGYFDTEAEAKEALKNPDAHRRI